MLNMLISRNFGKKSLSFENTITITVWKLREFSLTKNISSNQLFSNLFSKTVTFTKFLPKMHERAFS